ncbi:MAG: aminotransferase class I/II-fold pyridoxal phosphate-dependent enzyme [Hyphomonadaceae bacterium]|nr:aminotransferase class I/II-fold pyridoxal phosphate-dependent enzyme [Hyphomonadaceae bacterium]
MADAHSLSPRVDAYLLSPEDGVWTALHRALDGGFDRAFVVDAQRRLIGVVTIGAIRTRLQAGEPLDGVSAAALAQEASADGPIAPLEPVLDAEGRIIAVRARSDAAFLPVAEPDLRAGEFRRLLDAYLSTWISSTGDYLRAFENDFARRMDMEHGIATANGTVSLHLALVALGVGPGDEVIVPDLTFAASANTVIHCGATPVLVDVDPQTWVMSAAMFEAAITPRTRAVMPVHVFGRPAPMTEIRAIAQARGVFVVEDCAEAHGAKYDGKPVGSFSDVSSFSFFANKIITTGEGGMCLTNDGELAARMRMLRDHGMRPDRRYWHEEAGFNYRMTNLQGAIGGAQLDRLDAILTQRARVEEMYRSAFLGIPGVDLAPPMAPNAEPVTWFCCALTPADKRPALIAACKDDGIDLRPFFNSLSAMPAYRRYARPCPSSRMLAARGVNLPTSHKIDADAIERVARAFRRVLG